MSYIIFVIIIPATIGAVTQILGYGWFGKKWYIGIPLNIALVILSVSIGKYFFK